MFRISRLQEMMKALPRESVERIVAEHRADKHSKGFGSWEQLVAMVYGQLSGAAGLRDLEAGFNRHRAHHYHLGTGEVRRSTLADANGKRNPHVFEAVARGLMQRVHGSVRREGKRFMYLLEATAITLMGHGFDEWTKRQRTDHHQGVKLHVVYAAHAQAPYEVSLTAGATADPRE